MMKLHMTPIAIGAAVFLASIALAMEPPPIRTTYDVDIRDATTNPPATPYRLVSTITLGEEDGKAAFFIRGWQAGNTNVMPCLATFHKITHQTGPNDILTEYYNWGDHGIRCATGTWSCIVGALYKPSELILAQTILDARFDFWTDTYINNRRAIDVVILHYQLGEIFGETWEPQQRRP